MRAVFGAGRSGPNGGAMKVTGFMAHLIGIMLVSASFCAWFYGDPARGDGYRPPRPPGLGWYLQTTSTGWDFEWVRFPDWAIVQDMRRQIHELEREVAQLKKGCQRSVSFPGTKWNNPGAMTLEAPYYPRWSGTWVELNSGGTIPPSASAPATPPASPRSAVAPAAPAAAVAPASMR